MLLSLVMILGALQEVGLRAEHFSLRTGSQQNWNQESIEVCGSQTLQHNDPAPAVYTTHCQGWSWFRAKICLYGVSKGVNEGSSLVGVWEA